MADVNRACACTLISRQTNIKPFVCILIFSPCDEAGGDGRPGDTAGVWLLALLLLVFAATAQAAQVDGQTQEVDAERRGRHAAQEDERLEGDRRGERLQKTHKVLSDVVSYMEI